MKALRKLENGAGNVKIVEVPNPVPRKGEVLLKVERAGICGTDLHILHGHFAKAQPPVTLGHEFAGTVAELGPGVTAWRPGDRVTVESESYSCGKCRYCESGQTNLCPDRLAFGYGVDGGFAEFVAVRDTALHRLPDHVSFREAALSEPLAVAVHAVTECATVKPGQTVLVAGPGPIGLTVLQVARAEGAVVVISGTDKDEARLETATRMGGHSVRVDMRSLPDSLRELTAGEGVDLAFECSGSSAGLNDCLECVSRKGTVIQLGLFGRKAEVAVDLLALKEITLRGTFAHHHDTWTKAVDLLARKKVSLDSLVSGEFPLSKWEDAFRLSEEGRALKYLLYPD